MGELWYKRHIDLNPFSRIGRKLICVEFLIWHYTANPGATAENHIDYFQGLKRQNPHDNVDDLYASAHLFIDRDSAVEIIPLEEEAFHAGSRWYNQRSIGIELCIEKDGSFHPDTIKRAVQIGAFLCSKHKIDPIGKQLRHFDVTGKICPKPWVDHPDQFVKFKNDVASVMMGEYKMCADDANAIIKTYLKPAWQCAHDKGDKPGMKEAGRLADELRKASNQPVQNS